MRPRNVSRQEQQDQNKADTNVALRLQNIPNSSVAKGSACCACVMLYIAAVVLYPVLRQRLLKVVRVFIND